jgi:hypothetical protein
MVAVNLDGINLENVPVDFKFRFGSAAPAHWILRSAGSVQFQSSRSYWNTDRHRPSSSNASDARSGPATAGRCRSQGLCGSECEGRLTRRRCRPAPVGLGWGRSTGPVWLPDHHVLDEQGDEGALLVQVEAIPAAGCHALESLAVEAGSTVS